MASIEKIMTVGGKPRYRAIVRNGKKRISKTFMRAQEARSWADGKQADIREGRLEITERAKLHTLSDAIQKFISEILPAGDYAEKYRDSCRRYARWWESKLGSYTLAALTPEVISGVRDELARRKKEGTCNRYMAGLSRILRVAKREWRWLPNSPFEFISQIREPPGRTRYLNREELIRLLNVCQEIDEEILYPIVVLAVSSGARKGEILNIKCEDVDLGRKVILLTKTKNRTQRQVFLHGLALELIEQKLKKSKDRKKIYLFSIRFGQGNVCIEKKWKQALLESGIEGFRFHDLRHTAASYLAMGGATAIEIAEVLGHKQLSMTKRYSHLSQSKTSGVVEEMNKKFIEEAIKK